MAELSIGTQVRLRNNTTCTIKKELGRGGQGIVYLVDYKGGEYALKWYILEYGSAFYDNLERNVNKGAPSPSFLWPEAIKDGPSLTAVKDGIRGKDRLDTSIKLLINYGNNIGFTI